MRILIIGGTGHIGGFLSPMLANDGHEVTVVSTGRTAPGWADNSSIQTVSLNYRQGLGDGSFAGLLKERKIEAVMDILQSDTHSMYAACRESGVGHLVVCGSVWMFGRPKVVPTPEIDQGGNPFEGYVQRFIDMLAVQEQSKRDGYPFSAVMPPNICGPGKIPLDGIGGRSLEVHQAHKRGEEVILPYPGTNLVGPCDAEDVARGFFCAVNNREAAAGEIFNVGSAYAITSEKFIAVYGEIYGANIPIKYVSPETYITDVSPDVGDHFHFMEHMCPDISKISSRVGYKPEYTPEETMERAVRWMEEKGLL